MTGFSLVVMAAGMGSRYGGLKQIEPVGPNGEIIIDYSIYDALKAGFEKIVFVIREDNEEVFREKVGKNVDKLCETEYVFQSLEDIPTGFEVPPERVKPWGTAHAIFSCRDVITSPFAVINADDFYGQSTYKTAYNYLLQTREQRRENDFGLVGYTLENTITKHGHVARGVCKVDNDGFLLDITERTKVAQFDDKVKYCDDGETWIELPRDSIVSMNFWVFTLTIFNELEEKFIHFLHTNIDNLENAEFFIPEMVRRLISENKVRVKVLSTGENWFGVTYQKDTPRVQQAILDLIHLGVYPENLWE